jgi:serine/threonine protein kinase
MNDLSHQCSYTVLNRLIFAVNEEDLQGGLIDPLAEIIERQMPYFADKDGIVGFLRYLEDSPWREVIEITRDGFGKDNPRKPVTHWTGVDEEFRDLITDLTKFDPTQRLTAAEALEHKWFEVVE